MRSKPKNKEYEVFSEMLGKVMKVSRAEIKTRLEEEKAAKQKPKKTSVSGPASSEKD